MLPLVTYVLGHHPLQQLQVHAGLPAAQHKAVGAYALQKQRHALIGLQPYRSNHAQRLGTLVHLYSQQTLLLLVVEITLHQQVHYPARHSHRGQHGEDYYQYKHCCFHCISLFTSSVTPFVATSLMNVTLRLTGTSLGSTT